MQKNNPHRTKPVATISLNLLVLALAGASCSREKPQTPPASQTNLAQSTKQTGATPSQAGEVVVVFKHPKLFANPGPWNGLLDQFRQLNPTIVLRAEPVAEPAANLHTYYEQALRDKPAAFDVYAIDVSRVARFAQEGWLADLGVYLPPDERAQFFGPTLEAATCQGTLCAIPWIADATLLYYRQDLLAKHKQTTPQSWGELARVATEVTRREKELQGFPWATGLGEELTCSLAQFFYSNGGLILSHTKAVVDSPPNRLALDFAAKLVQTYKITPGPADTSDRPLDTFRQGKALFASGWTDAWSAFEQENSAVRGKVGVTVPPCFPGQKSAPILGGWHLGVNPRSNQPKAAALLVQFLSSLPAQQTLAVAYGVCPPRKTLYEHVEVTNAHPVLARFLPALNQARLRPPHPAYEQVSQKIQTHLVPALSGQTSPEEALRNLQRDLESSLPKTLPGPAKPPAQSSPPLADEPGPKDPRFLLSARPAPRIIDPNREDPLLPFP